MSQILNTCLRDLSLSHMVSTPPIHTSFYLLPFFFSLAHYDSDEEAGLTALLQELIRRPGYEVIDPRHYVEDVVELVVDDDLSSGVMGKPVCFYF